MAADGDGFNNLFEFLSATNPRVPDNDQGSYYVRVEGNSAVFGYRLTTNDRHLIEDYAEWSEDLINWSKTGLVRRSLPGAAGYTSEEVSLNRAGLGRLYFRRTALPDPRYSE